MSLNERLYKQLTGNITNMTAVLVFFSKKVKLVRYIFIVAYRSFYFIWVVYYYYYY